MKRGLTMNFRVNVSTTQIEFCYSPVTTKQCITALAHQSDTLGQSNAFRTYLTSAGPRRVGSHTISSHNGFARHPAHYIKRCSIISFSPSEVNFQRRGRDQRPRRLYSWRNPPVYVMCVLITQHSESRWRRRTASTGHS